MPSREIKIKKTQQTQYADDDNHHVNTNAISNSGMSFNAQDGSTLSGSAPYLCLTTII